MAMAMTMMMMMVMVMWTDMAIDGVLAVAIAGASFNILFCVLLPPHLGLRFGLTLAIFADAAADVAQLATAAGLLRQLCVSV